MADNPQAFPVAPILPDIREGSDGMTLLDYFAGQALASFSAKREPEIDALKAYDIAEAMLAERQRRQQGRQP